ncbi:MAG: DUF899 domain-containing protein [Terriglobia bacterium]
MATSTMERPKVVSQEEWLAARKELLAKEKELTRARDVLNEARQALPWVKVEKRYVFDGPKGKETLADLFDGRSQLVVRHFMFGPGWKEGCVGCSFASDHVGDALVHLEHHDITYVAVSRAPLSEIEPFKQRMSWRFKWVSSFENDFNFDYHVSFRKEEMAKGKVHYNYEDRDVRFPSQEASGVSVFCKDASGDVFHTYSAYARGDEGGLATYFYIDLTPMGRNEKGPTGTLADWVRHHDRYEAGGHVDAGGRYVAPETSSACCHDAAD